jgi:hypothetical protein
MEWRPAEIEDADPSVLSYIVVDEIEGGMLGLAASEWPRTDEKGRLRFDSDPALVGVERSAFERFVAEHRRPPELAERPLRIGDVFAAKTRPVEAGEDEPRLEPVLDPERWIEPPVYDVTIAAREAAKVSFYGAVAPALQPDEAARLAPLIEE